MSENDVPWYAALYKDPVFLVERIRKGDPAASEYLYLEGRRRWRPRLLGVLRDPDDADTIVTDAFLAIRQALDSGRLRNAAALWCFGQSVVERSINRVIGTRMRNRKRIVSIESHPAYRPESGIVHRGGDFQKVEARLSDDAPSPEEQSIHKQRRERTHRLALLGKSIHAVILTSILGDSETPAELQVRFGISAHIYALEKNRAIARLRRRLAA